jgi:hypothetical protein
LFGESMDLGRHLRRKPNVVDYLSSGRRKVVDFEVHGQGAPGEPSRWTTWAVGSSAITGIGRRYPEALTGGLSAGWKRHPA